MPIVEHYEIETLILSNGKCPFDEWIETLEESEKVMVDDRLIRVMAGSFGEKRSLQRGLWELKFRVGAAIRIYYGHSGQKVVLLLVGGNKRTQRKDIKDARKLWDAFKNKE